MKTQGYYYTEKRKEIDICNQCYEEIKNCHCGNKCHFGVDFEISDIISTLNKKGYFTLGSCSGHVYATKTLKNTIYTRNIPFSISFTNQCKNDFKYFMAEGILSKENFILDEKRVKDRFFIESKILKKKGDKVEEFKVIKQNIIEEFRNFVNKLGERNNDK